MSLRPRTRCRIVSTSAALGLLLIPAVALADLTKAQCIEANTTAQNLRRDGKLTAAREQLRACAAPSCPGILRDDCTKRLDEVEGAEPTIIFDAKDGAGHDLSSVAVTLDGQPFATKLDGGALAIDPGEHVLVFTVQGQPPVSLKLVVRESEKARHEPVVIGVPAAPPSVAALPAAEASAAGPSHKLGAPQVAGIVAAGVGVVGVVVGGVFGGLTASAISKQKTDCASATSCSNYAQAKSDHGTWTTDGTISTVGIIAGAALIAGGATLFFAIHAPGAQATSAKLAVTPSVGPGGGGMLLQGEF